MSFTHKGVKILPSPEDYYKHNEGRLTYRTVSHVPCVFTTGTTPAKHRNGESMMIRHRFDSLKLPHQQEDHVTNTNGENHLGWIHDDGLTREYPLSHPIGQDLYAGEYYRYIVEYATYKYTFTNYEPFAVQATVVIGATACTSALDQTFAAHLAAKSLKFGEDVGMSTSRYMGETSDYSATATGVSAALDRLTWTSAHLRRLQNAVHVILPAAPNSGVTAYGDHKTTGQTDLRGVTRTLTVRVPVLKLLGDIVNGGLTGLRSGEGLNLEQHSGTVLSSVDADGSQFSLPGPAASDGVAGTYANPGGVYGTVIITPVDPMRRLDHLDITDVGKETICSSKVFCQIESWHRVRLYDRVMNIPVSTIPAAGALATTGFLGLAGFQTAEVAETATTT